MTDDRRMNVALSGKLLEEVVFESVSASHALLSKTIMVSVHNIASTNVP